MQVTGKIDGRTARAQRTRDAIVNGLFDLLAEGEVNPKADAIAQRAGVSLRSIYQHFTDLDELFAEVVQQGFALALDARESIDTDLDLEERVAAVVERRSALYVRTAPLARAAFAQERSSDQALRTLQTARDLLRDEIARVFEPELAGLREEMRSDYLASLTAATSFAVFDLLVEREGTLLVDYQRITAMTLSALIAAAQEGSR